MSYVKSSLMAGEHVVRHAHIHWFIHMPALALFTVGILLINDGVGPFLILFSLYFMLDAIIKRFSTEFAITNKRVIAKFGLISRQTIELNLSKIESLNVTQGLFGRIFNYGQITVNGTGGMSAPLKFIAQPLQIRSAVNEQIEALQATQPQQISG
jgi:uncharacterized membrane protein YdbT with pleckstrin-like domain